VESTTHARAGSVRCSGAWRTRSARRRPPDASSSAALSESSACPFVRRAPERCPIYRPTAAYGHFGRSEKPGFFTWEKTDRAAELKDRLFGGKVSSKAAKSEAPKAKASKAEPKADAKNGAKADAKKGAKKAKETRAEA
jgi:hypothetical protein